MAGIDRPRFSAPGGAGQGDGTPAAQGSARPARSGPVPGGGSSGWGAARPRMRGSAPALGPARGALRRAVHAARRIGLQGSGIALEGVVVMTARPRLPHRRPAPARPRLPAGSEMRDAPDPKPGAGSRRGLPTPGRAGHAAADGNRAARAGNRWLVPRRPGNASGRTGAWARRNCADRPSRPHPGASSAAANGAVC